MRRFVLSFMAMVFGLGVVGCLASKEEGKKIADDLLANVTALADTLEGAKDAPSAKDAIPKIKEIGGKLKELKDTNVKVSKSTQEEILQEYKQRMEEATERVGKEVLRLSKMPGGQEITNEAATIMVNLGAK